MVAKVLCNDAKINASNMSAVLGDVKTARRTRLAARS
jgi:hypothetical protein